LTSNHFFVPKAQVEGGRAVVRGRESRHLGRVLRGRPGDEVWLFDEDGVRYRARVRSASPEEVVFALLERLDPAPTGTRVTLAQAVLKAKAMDGVVQKAAEFGVAAFVPVVSRRSVARLDPRDIEKSGRWARIALEAAKQARTGRPPAIAPVCPLEDFLDGCDARAKIVLSEHGGERLRTVLETLVSRNEGRPPESVALLVGPEGGWSAEEEASWTGAGFLPALLGRTVLRAETAALAVLAIVSHDWTW
jgi:16S rRNA (uracil1498-N3)-methyltransferase